MPGALVRGAAAIALGLAAACATGRGSEGRDAAARDRGAGEGIGSERSAALRARPERPVFFEVVPPAGYRAAVERGTRTATGAPGPAHWQQWAEYSLTTRLDTAARRLAGSATIVYHNNSPDTLRELNVHLHQNLHAPGAVRADFAEVTDGVELSAVHVAGRELPRAEEDGGGRPEEREPGYRVIGTRLAIVPPAPVPPAGTVELGFEYAFRVPQAGASGRMGWSRDDLFFLAYWYPQMAVYDDVIGWHVDQFVGNAEFYAGFADYDVTIEAPAGWLVRATGDLGNPEETLAAPVLERLRAAAESDSIVHVVRAADLASATRPGQGALTWRFRADSVRDFAFSATRGSLLDATRTPVGDLDGDGKTDYARIEALYRESAPLWREVARYAAHSIRTLSVLTATPYPWPHMTAVEGAEIIGGGMEFPMMTLIGDYNARGDTALYAVTAHELAHMWVPMIVSNNERRYAWMDEGTTTYNENRLKMDFFPGIDWDLPDQEAYVETALAGEEGPILRWSDYHYPGRAYGIASYQKPATVLAALASVLGDETFRQAYHEFYDRWAWKHPYPWDLFRTFEDVSGRDLDWFWRSWYHETWTLDQAVIEVNEGPQGPTVVVEDQGYVPMPVDLAITRGDGSVERRTIPVDDWLAGRTRTTITLAPGPPVTRVEIDPERDLPDVDRTDNVWVR